MNRSIVFVAMLFVGALCLYGLSALQLFEHVELQRVQVAPAQLRYADMTEPLASGQFDGRRLYKFDLQWRDAEGDVVAVPRYVTRDQMQTLVAGGEIEIAYLPGDPRRRVEAGASNLGAALGLFVGGLLATAVALFALRLLRRESGASA